MLLIPTSIAKSGVHGIGLFTDIDVPKGDPIYNPSPNLDINLSQQEFEKLDKISQWHITHYGYVDGENDRYHLAFDNIRFCNHSSDSNNIGVDEEKDEYILVALRNIDSGEELLQDFREFEKLRTDLV